MKILIKVALSAFGVAILMTGCAQKVQIKALAPAEVGEMASMKKIAVTDFKNDKIGLSGKIESSIAKHKLDKKRYFTVLSRKDINKVIAEQELQSSDLLDEKTASRVGKLIGAQALINGEVASANGESSRYRKDMKECLSYYKKGGCARWHFYKKICNTTKATVSANINIVDIETGTIIYGDNITKDYNGDSCKPKFKSLFSGPQPLLSKRQAINKLSSDIANEFVHKITPNYVHFNVALLESIEYDGVNSKQEQQFENALEYIKAGRMIKAKAILSRLMDEVNGKSYVVAYDSGVVSEALGKLDDAKKLYVISDNLTPKPIDEVNLAMVRIDNLIEKGEEAKKQMNAK